MTPKECPELSYLNLHIIQYLYVISIYQTSHIYDTIVVQLFPYASEKFNSITTTFKADITFELSLAYILTDTPY